MNNYKLFKHLLTISFLVSPVLGFSQAQNIGIWNKLLFGVAGIVIISVLISIINLNKTLVDLQLERQGVASEKKPIQFWKKWKEKLTDIVPVEKESDILLDHNYDGISELDNNLPPWWLYGFYLSIVYAIFYIGYFHYYDYGKNSIQQYEFEIAQAEIAVNNYRENQANNIDESNLLALTDPESLSRGKAVFTNNCVACHMKGGGGSPISVGPNLTDEYWLHDGDIKGIFKTIKYGVPTKGMIAWKDQLNPADMHSVASYILSLQGTNPPNAKDPQGDKYLAEELESN